MSLTGYPKTFIIEIVDHHANTSYIFRDGYSCLMFAKRLVGVGKWVKAA